MEENSPNEEKTLCENYSLRAISPLSTVFSRLVLQMPKNLGLFGKGLMAGFVTERIKFFVAETENVGYKYPFLFSKVLFLSNVKKI